jgi:hypothetical protein
VALGDPYTTVDQLKSYLQIADTVDDAELEDALATATREIETHCDRQFNDSGSATARVFHPDSMCLTPVDDFHTTAGLIVRTDSGGDGSYATTWDAADYQLEPLNGIMDGLPGWPYNKIRAVSSKYFPTCHRGAHDRRVTARRASVEVTATWGWAAVPDPVRQACLILAAETFKLRSAPFGVAGFGEYGVVRVRENPKVCSLLKPYELYPVMVA